MTETAMARQLSESVALGKYLHSRWRYVVVMERIAKGGSETRWYLAQDQIDVKRIFMLLCGGSRVSFSLIHGFVCLALTQLPCVTFPCVAKERQN